MENQMTTRPEDGLDESLASAGAALGAFASGPARDAAGAVGAAFEAAGRRMSRALGAAARTGELSVRAMVGAILSDLSRIAIEQAVTGPLASALGKALGSAAFSGARAGGGPVTPGGAYLVGERGPELFRPGVAGSIGPAGGGVSVHVHVGAGADAQSIVRSSSQVATALARAVQRGSRGL
jgi:hypothetical protein